MAPANFDTILDGRRSQPQQLIEVLQDVQETYGYISQDAMKAVSKHLGVPLIEVYRVATFYKAFSLKPRGKHIATICMGTACHVRGAKLLLDQVQGQLKVAPGDTTEDGLFTLERVNCLGACALGPLVVMDGKYHDYMAPNKLRSLIDQVHKDKGEGKAHA
jgi:NADH:ubiquinone oxidoreductase subunit E